MTAMTNKLTDLAGITQDNAVRLPADGTTATTKLEPGAYTQFLFKMNQIEAVELQGNGALSMKLTNGSTLVIENFQALANSAESCGRDTIFQMLKDVAGPDGQVSGVQIVNISPDALLRALDPTLADDKTIQINAPEAGMTREVVMEPGQDYKFNFDWNNAAKTIDGTNLMLSFKNGGLVILRDFVPVTAGDLPPAMTLADGSAVDANHLIATSCAPTEGAPMATLRAPDIEPAAGERAPQTIMKKAPVAVESAQALADIEPAAGGGNSPASGGRGGAGFSSNIDAANLNGLNPLGPIGPTALAYGIPQVGDDPAAGTPVLDAPILPPPPINPPPVPTLVVEDKRVYEDGGVALSLSTTAPAGTTTVVTVTGFPAGWVVEPGLGTFNAVTRTWTISLPAGADFTGGPVVRPPANSDGDIAILNVTSTATDGITGLASTATGMIKVTTDAVADVPNLSASATGTEDGGAELNIATAPTDTDGSEVISAIYVSGFPAGFSLNKGVLQNDGSYKLTLADLTGLKVNGPANYSGSVTLTVKSIVTETNFSGGEFDFTNNIAQKIVTVTVPFGAAGDQPTLDVQDICILEDGSLQLPITARLTDRDGSEYLTVTVEGIPAGWRVDPNGGTYNAATGKWTITLAAGADFTGGPTLYPPANSDVDAPDLKVTATSTESSNGSSASIVKFADARVDAVADAPNLNVVSSASGEQVIRSAMAAAATSVEAPDSNVTSSAVGEQGPSIALTVTSSLNDTDGSEVLSIRVTGLPAGATLSAGALQPDGSYILTATQLAGLKVIPAAGFVGSFVLTFTATATETNLSGDECDPTNNVATTTRTITVDVGRDDVPVIINAQNIIDETNLGPINVGGTVNINYGADGPGVMIALGAASFASSGSRLGGALTSNGVPVTVTLDGNIYTGKAGNVTVFTLQVNTDGTYAFRLFDNLDHADGNNPDDVISLSFGIKATDKEGDATNGTITIQVKDDAPIANDDSTTAQGGVAVGNVTTNDDRGEDGPGAVTAVTFNGVTTTVPATGNATIIGLYGTLVIAATGAYTYTANNGANGVDRFVYTLTDRDGDRDTADLTISTSDGKPILWGSICVVDETDLGPVVVGGTLIHDFGADGPGAITPEGIASFVSSGSRLGNTLTSNGVPVVVTLESDTYIGRAGGATVFTLQIGTNGAYNFRLLDNLDHADGANPNDVITLAFGVKITDRDGDSATHTITVNVYDDAPDARDDTGSTNADGVAVGNVTGNDDPGEDNPGTVTQVVVNGVTTTVPATGTATIIGLYGTLVIAATGAYTYTARNGANGSDAFTYTLRDRDGDRDTAILRIASTDGQPTIGDSVQNIDETNLGPINVGGTLASNYGADGAGSIAAQGVASFISSGSRLGNILTSNGVPVVVTLEGNTYVGKAGGVTVFTLQVNADGSYNFNLRDNLDHADRFNPNDVITLAFGVKITDRDGDTDTGAITINVLDDAPVPTADQCLANMGTAMMGNVLRNDASTEGPYVSAVSFNGQTYTVAATGVTTVVGAYGTLTIERDGDYVYTPKWQVVNTILEPICDDVIFSDTQPILSKNGVTIEAIDPTTGRLAADLSWVFDENNLGNEGIGVNGGAVNGAHEGMRITYGSEPADAVWITVGNWNSVEQASGALMARVYLNGSDTPVTMALLGGVPGPYSGIMSYKLDADSQFNHVPITKVELYLNDLEGQYGFTLINVAVERYVEGTDQFGYTVTDYDGDSANSTLSVVTDNDSVRVGAGAASVVAFDDDVTLAIGEFVAKTEETAPISSKSIGIEHTQPIEAPIAHDPAAELIQQAA